MNDLDIIASVTEEAPVLRNASDLAQWTKQLCEARGIALHDAVSKIQKWGSGSATLADFPTTDMLKAMAEEVGMQPPIVDLWDLLPASPFDDDKTLAGEIRAWAHRLAAAHRQIMGPRLGRTMTLERTAEIAEMIALKFIYEGERPASNAAKAESQAKNTTYPNALIEGAISRRGIIRPRITLWERIRTTLIEVCPKSSEEIATMIAEDLGAGMGVNAAIEWATQQLGHEEEFRWEDIPSVGRVLLHETSGGWFRAAYRTIRAAVRFRGAAWMPLIYADAIRESGEAVAWGEFVAAVEKVKGYKAVGERGWFTLDLPCENRCFDLIDNIIASAGRACTVETLHEGVFRSQIAPRSPSLREQLPASLNSVMPIDEFRQLIEETNRYRMIAGSNVDIVRLEDRRSAMIRLNKGAEFMEFVRSRSGIITSTEAMEVSGSPKYITLRRSPIFRLVEDGIYALRGIRIDAARLAEAQEERDKNSRTTGVEVKADGTVTFVASFYPRDRSGTGTSAVEARVPIKATTVLYAGPYRNEQLNAEVTISEKGIRISGRNMAAFGLYGPQRARIFINPKREDVEIIPLGDECHEQD